MSWQTPRERNFSLGGPFIAKKGGNAGDIVLVPEQVYTAHELADAGLSTRNIQHMYQAHWFDMAPVDGLAAVDAGGEAPPVMVSKEAENPPVSEQEGPSSSDTPENAENAPDGPEIENTGTNELEAEAADEGNAPAAEAEEGGAPVGDAVTPPSDAPPADTKLAAYKCFGFGAYYPVNAAGEKLDTKKLSKPDASGRAARDAVPMLNSDGTLITEE